MNTGKQSVPSLKVIKIELIKIKGKDTKTYAATPGCGDKKNKKTPTLRNKPTQLKSFHIIYKPK